MSERLVGGSGPLHLVTVANDSPRGRWTYCEWHPPALAGLVELIRESQLLAARYPTGVPVPTADG